MSLIPKAQPEPKINIDTPQHVSSDKEPPKVTDASFYGNTMVGGSRADSLLAVKGMVIRTLGESTTGAAISATDSARTGANLAGPLGMALYYESYTPNSRITH